MANHIYQMRDFASATRLNRREPVTRCPQAKSGMGNEEYFFPVDGVVAVVHGCGVILGEGGGQIGIGKSYAFYLAPREPARAISNVETPFGGAVNEVGGGQSSAARSGLRATISSVAGVP